MEAKVISTDENYEDWDFEEEVPSLRRRLLGCVVIIVIIIFIVALLIDYAGYFRW